MIVPLVRLLRNTYIEILGKYVYYMVFPDLEKILVHPVFAEAVIRFMLHNWSLTIFSDSGGAKFLENFVRTKNLVKK